MKQILIAIILIAFLLVILWLSGAMPTDEEIEKGQRMKIEKQIKESKPKCWSYPEFTGKDKCFTYEN